MRSWRRWARALLASSVSWAIGVALAQGSATQPVPAAETTVPRADVSRLDYRLQARSLAPGVWVVEGDNADFSIPNGCNIINTGFIATGAGVVVINTGTSRLYGEQLRALIARTTAEPVVQVVQLNLHPDYFLGNQAFADVPRLATALTHSGVKQEAASYETNLYRLCGDWMKGTEALGPNQVLDVSAGRGQWRVGSRSLSWVALRGHTASDLVVIDDSSGVAFAGGLVFHRRVPTTPHAQVPDWLASLGALRSLGLKTVVPSHGPVHEGLAGLEGTQGFLTWLDRNFRAWATEGREMNDVLRSPLPEEFRQWAAIRTEWVRNVAHLYPRYESQVLNPVPSR
jgi:quinoprotein relay system zinc metallohydrolase 1